MNNYKHQNMSIKMQMNIHQLWTQTLTHQEKNMIFRVQMVNPMYTNMSFELENPSISLNDEHVENEFNKPLSGYPDERVRLEPKLPVIRSRRKRII